MKTINSFTIKVAAALLIFCSWSSPDKPLDKAQWLTGTWKCETKKGSLYENWRRLNDNEYAGKSYMLKETDTLVFERIRLVVEKNEIYYIPQVSDQNKGLPVRFKAITFKADEMVFENKAHDFPKRISYRKINADSLVAEISGDQVGMQRFAMKKISAQ